MSATAEPCIDNGCTAREQYKSVNVGGRRTRLHRKICADRHSLDLWDKSWVARHTCDNKRCIEPTHIVPGSAGDNIKDAYDRNRRGVKGAAQNARLTTEQMLSIPNDLRPNTVIAAEYGVGEATIRYHRKGGRR